MVAQTSKLKRMNVFLHKHIKVYNLYSNKIEKVLKKKKKIYNWAQSAPVQHEKETTSEKSFALFSRSLGHGCVSGFT